MALTVFGVEGIPLVKEGDNIPRLIYEALEKQGQQLQDKDIVVVTQKIVSKAEGRVTKLDTVTPSKFAYEIAESMDKDPRIVEVVLGDTARVIRMKGKVLIVETRHGHVCANAGVDFSNVEDGHVTLLPEDPDKSATEIRDGLIDLTRKKLGVIITDTWGRAWRLGQVDFAIGVAGMSPFRDYRGETDMMGHILSVTNIAAVDEIAAAAELVKGKAEGVPVVIVRGYDYIETDGKGADLVRPIEEDLFR
ncbi:MAG: coenzyme F420-0:L-glutamate ligase [Candidatus Bathyarchaeota archaeon]|nr:coenzyme F420-0:L-glutamate ligase [Candidatus Bathyarchaeota archaeon]